MKFRQFTGLILLVAVLLSSCSKKGPDYARYIPKTAGYVISFDVQRLTQKLAEDSLTMENMLSVLKDDHDSKDYSEALAKWAEFRDAGVDFEQKVLVAIPALDVTTGSASFQMVAGLKDAAKLEAFIAKMPQAPKVQQEGDISMVDMGDMVLGWKKGAVMMVGTHTAEDYDLLNDSTEAPIGALPGAEGVKALLKKFFEQKKDESILSVKDFVTALEKPSDVMVFTNSDALTGATVNPFMAAMQTKLKELLQGVYSVTRINFEEGRILMENEAYAGAKMSELLKKYAGPVVDMSLVERYPGSNVNTVTAFSFNPQLLPAFLQETGFDALAGVALAETGITMDEVIKAFKGDFAIMSSDFTVKTMNKGQAEDFMSYMPTGQLLAAVRIGDKAAFDKLLALAEKQQLIRREGNRIYPVVPPTDMAAGNAVVAGVENDVLIIASDSALYAGYAAAKSNPAVKAGAVTALKGKSIGFYVDAASILQGIPDAVFDSSDLHEKNILHRSRETFREMWFNTANFDGKKISSQGEVVMAPGKNALPQMVRFLMYAAEEMKLKEKEEEALYQRMESSLQ